MAEENKVGAAPSALHGESDKVADTVAGVTPINEAGRQGAAAEADEERKRREAALAATEEAATVEERKRRETAALEERKRHEAALAAAAIQAENAVDVLRKGRELERGEFIMPRRIMQAYTEVDGKFFAKDSNRMMFHDQGDKLAKIGRAHV